MKNWNLSRRQFLTTTLAAAVATTLRIPAIAGLPMVGGSFAPELRQKLESALDDSFAKVRAPGVVAAVSLGDLIWTATRGTTTMGGKEPATLDLHTRVGSVTKTMVGTLTLQAVDEGVLRVDDTIDKWFPDFPRAGDITILMLGTMASGIGSYTFDDAWVDVYLKNPTRSWTPDELIAAAARVPRPFEPGKGMQYCNTNFVMLGMIAEKLRGKPLGEVLREHLFEPLQMTNSSYPTGLDLPQKFWHGYTLQGAKDDKPLDATNWSPTFGAGAGEVVSNLHDLRIWARALGTGALLKRETQELRCRPNPHSTKDGRSYCFALGSNNGWLEHSGELPGFNTQVSYLPSKDLSIAVMANSDLDSSDGSHPAVAVYHALAATLAPENPLAG